MRRLGPHLCILLLGASACFEDISPGTNAETGSGDGDGDMTSSGDGDGDPSTGDGDMSGDGDGDPATGDGDGDGDTDTDTEGDDTEPPVISSFTVDGLAMPPVLERAAFVELDAEVTDNVAVTRVEFYVGDSLIGEALSAPWVLSWKVNDQALNGLTELSARAFDAAENQGDSEIVELGIALPPPGELVWESDVDVAATIEDLAVDSAGDVIAVGQIDQGADDNNFAIYKLDPRTGDAIWVEYYDNGQRNDQAWAVAIAPNGDILVGGNSTETGCPPQACDHLAVTRRYDSDANFQWMATDAGGVRDLDIHGQSGDIVVAGTNGTDVYLRRWLPDGTGDWTNSWNNSSNDSGRGVAVLPGGQVVVSGATEVDGDRDVFVQRRMAASGSIADTLLIDCADAADFTFDMSGDAAGNVYVAMRLCGDNSTVHKYDANGNLVWELDENDFGDVGGFNGIRSIAAGPNDGLAIGTWAGSPLNIWVAKYTQDGGELWTASATDDISTSVADAIAIDELGYVYAGGRKFGEGVGWVGCFHP